MAPWAVSCDKRLTASTPRFLTNNGKLFAFEAATKPPSTITENREVESWKELGARPDRDREDGRDVGVTPADECDVKFHPVAGAFPELEGQDFAVLVADIKARGLLQPILVHPDDGSIIDGRARYKACQEAGVEPMFKKWDGKGSLIELVVSLNALRRHLTPSQRAALSVDLQTMLEVAAAERKKATQAKPGLGKVGSVVTELSPPENKGKSRDQAAKLFRVSSGYVAAAKRIKERCPDLYDRVRGGDMTLQQAEHAIRRSEKEAVAERIRKEPQPLPQGPYRVIVADPAWKYDRDDLPYPTMTIQQIKELPVGALAHKDCVLWLWTTNAHLPLASDVLDSWGFEYRSILTWAKDRMGHGEWLRNQTEHCLLATRGNPVFTAPGSSTLLNGPTREHSRKPETFYQLVEATRPGTKLELFSRQERDGWVVWGAEQNLFAA